MTIPLISIHTPSWNRANYLERVWQGLCEQNFQNFEWIVSDDGSTDETQKILLELKQKSSFPVVIVSASARVGKAVLDNHAIRIARGEFFVWNDSDDILLPNALETLIHTWESIPEGKRDEFVGVTALCKTKDGVLSSLPFSGVFDTTWNDLRYLYKVQGDMVYFSKTKLLKEIPFKEVDFVISEGIIWTSLGNKYKTRVIPNVLKLVEYQATNAISFSSKLRYCRGYAYAFPIIRNNLVNYKINVIDSLWESLTFIRYCIHGEIGFFESMKLWNGHFPLLKYLLLFPLSWLLVLKDRLQCKVDRTHRDFLSARRIAIIAINR
jgi:glycosyltransferase involved in cell wall biosynthesis